MLRICVLLSGRGRGTNLGAILDACRTQEIPARVGLVIATREDAPALERARAHGVPAVAIPPGGPECDQAYGDAMLEALRARQIGLICLAGYLRLLPQEVVREYRNRILNIHPALLPLFGGKGMYGERVHRAALESGMKVSGCTVHIVDERYDTGPIVLQSAVPIEEDDTPASLAARILPVEHETYVRAIRLFTQGSLQVEGGRVRILPPGSAGVGG